jgi:ATP-binding cassette subfamily F protein uup
MRPSPIRDFSTVIMRGDKIGIIGPNGSGKTTLLNILLGSLKPLHGTVRMGTRLEVAYFDQHRAQLNDEKSVMDNVGDGCDSVTVNGRTRHIIGYLEDFLFPPERSRSPVKVLQRRETARFGKALHKAFECAGAG